MKSRVRGDFHARFRERVRVKLPRSIRPCPLMAGVSRRRNGFQKAGEKLAETEEDLLEHRTNGSDAYDTLYIGCEKFPQHDVFAFDAGGVM